jgi:hypothetical protein
MVDNQESIVSINDEKTVFERAIIEAFKEKTSKVNKYNNIKLIEYP